MATNRGTFEGDLQEIAFVKDFNKNKTNEKFLLLTKDKDIKNLFMIRVSTNQLSKLSNKITKTRADCYLISCYDEKIKNLLLKNDYYLNEENIKEIKYEAISYSGISVKLEDSDKYQILKVGPHSFYELFGNYELGAGASLFCLRDDELVKNKNLLLGWNTDFVKMEKYFNNMHFIEFDLTNNRQICSTIKTYSNLKIKELINNSMELKQLIFNGYPIYDEPYSAWYLYSHGKIEKLTYIAFDVTTGSGRSHGDYTIVLKPKKED